MESGKKVIVLLFTFGIYYARNSLFLAHLTLNIKKLFPFPCYRRKNDRVSATASRQSKYFKMSFSMLRIMQFINYNIILLPSKTVAGDVIYTVVMFNVMSRIHS